MKRMNALVLSAAMTLTLLSGCGQKPAAPAPGGSDGPSAGGNSAITVILKTVGNNLDPSVANAITTTTIANHIYDNLLECDADFNILPGVASSWEQPDPLTYVLTIGGGFVFHNGEPLEMEDVEYSVNRLADIAQTADVYAQIDSVSIDGNKLIVKIKEANSGFVRYFLSMPVLDKSYCESVGAAYANAPIGTGPYTLSSYIPGESAVLTKWADYPFENKPSIDTITFKGIEEPTAAYMAVESGNANFSDVDATDYSRAKANDKITFYEGDSTYTAFVSMNTQAAPFDNVNVRRAMAYAYNKEGYLNVKGENYATIDSMFPAMTEYYAKSPDTITYDPAKAKELLAAEGYDESNPLTFEISGYSNDDPVMQAYQADLAAIGVKADLVTYEFGVFLDNMAGQNFQMLAGGWGDATGNPLSAAECYYSKSFGVLNISFYENALADELYTAAKAATDDAVVVEKCSQLQDLAWQDVPMFPTFTRTEAFVYSKDLTGPVIYPSGIISFRAAELA